MIILIRKPFLEQRSFRERSWSVAQRSSKYRNTLRNHFGAKEADTSLMTSDKWRKTPSTGLWWKLIETAKNKTANVETAIPGTIPQ